MYATAAVAMLLMQSVLSQVESSYEYKDYAAPEESPGEDTHIEYDIYENMDYGFGAYSFNEYVIPDTEPIVLDCYTCHYSKHKYHEQGLPNCDDPFQEEGIPTIKCEGLCAKTRTVLGDNEYMLIRSCLPNCRDIVEPESSVYCCFGERCNGAKAGAFQTTASLTVCSVVIVFGVIFLCIMSI